MHEALSLHLKVKQKSLKGITILNLYNQGLRNVVILFDDNLTLYCKLSKNVSQLSEREILADLCLIVFVSSFLLVNVVLRELRRQLK